MKILVKIYLASCLIFLAFLSFFVVPVDTLGAAPSATAIVTGGIILAILALYIGLVHRREGIEFGWFLANRGGFWVICLAAFALLLFISGLLARIAPDAVVPAFERGAMPVAAVLVVVFWLALIYMFVFLAVPMFGDVATKMRAGMIKKALGSLGLGAICLGLAAVFFSLFTEVINDVFVRLSETARSSALWIFTFIVVAAGTIDGLFNAKRYMENGDEGD